MYFISVFLKIYKLVFELSWICKSIFLLNFYLLLIKIAHIQIKFKVLDYTLFFNLGTKVHMTQSSEIYYNYFPLTVDRNLIERLKYTFNKVQ